MRDRSGQQGGRLRLFPNREKAFSIYLTNQSSEEKRVFARLYRVKDVRMMAMPVPGEPGVLRPWEARILRR